MTDTTEAQDDERYLELEDESCKNDNEAHAILAELADLLSADKAVGENLTLDFAERLLRCVERRKELQKRLWQNV